MCATVYDVIQVPTTGQIQQVPATASTPPPTDSPAGFPLPDGTYYDPVTGQIYDPYGVSQQGGGYYDPSGQYGPSTGIVPPYGLQPGDTTDIPGFEPYDPRAGAYPTEYQLPMADEDGDFSVEDQYSSGYSEPGRISFAPQPGPSSEDFYNADYGEMYNPYAPVWGDDVQWNREPMENFFSTAEDW